MNFGEAIEALKQGKFVARKGWNGKGMYLWLMPAATIKAEWCKEPHLKALAEKNGGEIECLGSIRMKTADNKILTGWLASQTDMLSEDWVIYEDISDMWNYRNVRYFRADVGPISFEDGEVNGFNDDDESPIIPCAKDGRWNILIDIYNGKVLNWTDGGEAVEAKVYYKVCDDGIYTAYDNNMDEVFVLEDYVPKIMAFDDEDYGWGDYMSLKINKEGFIENWPNKEEIKYFIDSFLDSNNEDDY